MNSQNRQRLTVCWLVVTGLSLAACGDGDEAARDGKAKPGEASIVNTVVQDSCKGKKNGTSCGEGLHCVADRCQNNTCGDGIVGGDEVCDDGNESADDGCTPSCRIPPGQCGDGVLDPKEECDDGNREDDDFCTNKCLRQLCRNGIVDASEECDDGNSNPEDKCNNQCLKVVCGDQRVMPPEECDDGNAVDDGDDCSNACTKNVCGNNRIDPGEVCDGRITRTDDPKKPGKVPEGFSCSKCTQIAGEDACSIQQKSVCKDFMQRVWGTDVDPVAGCYSAGYKSEANETTADDVAKCTAVSECARQYRCDLLVERVSGTGGGVLGCACGEDGPGSGKFDQARCALAPTGPCVKQLSEATQCPVSQPSLNCIEARLSDPGFLGAYFAVFVTECQRVDLASVCRQ